MGSKKKKPKTSYPPKEEMAVTDISKIAKTLVISYKYLDTSNKKYSMNSLTDTRIRLKYSKDFNEKMKEYCNHENFKTAITKIPTIRINGKNFLNLLFSFIMPLH